MLIYSASVSLVAFDGEEVDVRVCSSIGEPGERRQEDYTFSVPAATAPDDLRDWLRQALAAAIESI